MYVTKRNGQLEEFDISKTKKVVEWACEGLDVNPLELESQIDIIFNNKIKTSDIQDNLIEHCLTLISKEYPDWQIVAGRLKIMPRWKLLEKYSLREYIEKKVNEGIYTPKLLEKYYHNAIDYLETFIDNKLDLIYNYASVVNCINKYLLEDEPLQYMLMASSMMVADNVEEAIKYYKQSSNRKNTLISKKVRFKDPSLSSCFIITVEDSLESIYYALTQSAKISKNGGGVGVCLSNIRATGSSIKHLKGASGGVLPWIKLFNDTAIAVNQLGRRQGAITIGLDCWHYDIIDFLNVQTEHGEQRLKSYDIFPQLIINDTFIEALKDDKDWWLFDPYEVKQIFDIDLVKSIGDDFKNKYINIIYNHDKLNLSKCIKARDLLRSCMETMIETGLPYITNKDEINKHNPNKHLGIIEQFNLCTESTSITNINEAHTCDLLSINLTQVESLEELKELCFSSVKILDNMIDLGVEPIIESTNHHKKYRVLGIGTTGLHDYLVKNNHTYESAQKIGFIKDLYERIQYWCIEASIELAKDKGSFLAFEKSEWDNGNRIKFFKSNSNLELRLDWGRLQSGIDVYGIRNSQLTAIAPGTNTSLALHSTPSVLPSYAPMYYEANSNGNIPIVAPFLKGNELRYKKYSDFNQKFMVDVISDIQKFVCSGISFETIWDINKETTSNKAIFDNILYSFNKGIKALYYTRFIQKDILKDVNSCVACAD